MSGGERAAPAAIEAIALERRFGAVRALDRVDLVAEPGSALALFGANGAGKTTLVRVLTLGLAASGGSLRIAGLVPRRDAQAIRSRIGVVSHQTWLYDDLSPRQNLEFFARLYGVDEPARRAAGLLDELGLSARADDAVGTLSRGMQQRVALARAIVHDPEILFLDEPFSGLDPRAAALYAGLLRRLHARGRTLLLATHDLGRGLELCDRFAVLDRGRIVAGGRVCDSSRVEIERRFFGAG